MSSFHLPHRRKIELMSFSIDATHEGILEGSPQSVTPHILRLRQEDAQGKARVIIEPQKPYIKLPDWECLARFYSRNAARTTDPDYASRLEVIWWIADTNKTIDSLVEEILPFLEWETYAEDYDIMAF